MAKSVKILLYKDDNNYCALMGDNQFKRLGEINDR